MTRPTPREIATAISVLIPALAGAQTARGAVRDSTAGAPLPGVVVLALDSAGHSTARAITDSAGRFSVGISRARRLRVLRIGYVARELPLAAAAGDVVLDVAMLHVPPLLAAVRVAEREVCPNGADDSTTAAFQLWNQARAGLLGAVVAAAANPVTATTITYQRRVSPSDDLVRGQTIARRAGFVARPFAAAEPRRLAQRGYMDEDATGRSFLAPDADVLLDESFAATHCFHLHAADAAHRGEVGVAFAPTPDRDTVVDVSGVIWMDSAASALRSLEFLYTALEPAALRAQVGGRVDFRTVSNGVTFVERWRLRVPVMTPFRGAGVPLGIASPGVRRRMNNDGVRVLEIQETGGEVIDGAWHDGTKWNAPLAGLTGFVRERGRDAPVAGALVSLAGGSDVAVSDATGGFMLAPAREMRV